MPQLARIRLAGTIVATAMCAVAASEASAQTPPPGGLVLNGQIQDGDIFAGQTLNVVDSSQQITTTAAATGNSLSGSAANGVADIRSTQTMNGDALAQTVLTVGGDTGGVVTLRSQATGNYVGASGYGADVAMNLVQTNAGSEINSTVQAGNPGARFIGGGSLRATTVSNQVAVYGEGSDISGSIDQSSSATVRSAVLLQSQYARGKMEAVSDSVVNSATVNSNSTSGQNFTLRQRSTGDYVDADANASAGNGWDLASQGRAVANQGVIYNQGGAVTVASDQLNSAEVSVASQTFAYDYGAGYSNAYGAGNELSVGNNDAYISVDNTQLNSGGVDVTANFSGTNGYDAYVGATAVGNAATGYACAQCDATMQVTNSQTNAGDVGARANVGIPGGSRATISGVSATGNSATFYTSNPNH